MKHKLLACICVFLIFISGACSSKTKTDQTVQEDIGEAQLDSDSIGNPDEQILNDGMKAIVQQSNTSGEAYFSAKPLEVFESNGGFSAFHSPRPNGGLVMLQTVFRETENDTFSEDILLILDENLIVSQTISVATILGEDISETDWVEILSVQVTAEDVIHVLVRPSLPDEFAAKEEIVYDQLWMLKIDANGVPIGEKAVIRAENHSFENAQLGYDGSVFACLSTANRSKTIAVFTANGQEQFRVGEDAAPEILQKQGFNFLKDAEQMYIEYAEAEGEKYYLPVDMQEKKLGEPVKGTGVFAELYYNAQYFIDGSPGLSYTNQEGVFIADVISGQSHPVLYWRNQDVAVMGKRMKCVILSDSRMFLELSGGMSGGLQPVQWYMLQKEETNPNAGKKILRLAGWRLERYTDLQQAVSLFNQTQPEYRVEMYDTAVSAVSEQDGGDLGLEILSGNAPDMYFNPQLLGVSNTYLMDLYPLMEQDISFLKDDFYENVLFTGNHTDGKLFSAVFSFGIRGIAGPREILGDRTGWTVEELDEIVSNLPGNMSSFRNTSQQTFLLHYCGSMMEEFIDPVSGDVNFQNKAFYDALTFSQKYGIPDSEATGENWVDEKILFQNGELAFDWIEISSVSDYISYRNIINGGFTLVGFPGASSPAPIIEPNGILGISSSSGNPEGAWAFLKYVLYGASRQSGERFFSVCKKITENEIQKMTTEANGNTAEMLSTEDAAALRKMISTPDKIRFAGYAEIENIIIEESAPFFVGQKAVEDTAYVIQERVKTHVQENA